MEKFIAKHQTLIQSAILFIGSLVAIGFIFSADIGQWFEQNVNHDYDPCSAYQKAGGNALSVPNEIKAHGENNYAAYEICEANKRGMDWPAWVEAFAALITAIFTGILAVATIRLWNSTKGLHDETKKLAALAEVQSADTKASIEVARRAAEAAELTARAAIGVELPILNLESMQCHPPIPKEEEGMSKWCSVLSPSLSVKNFGRTHAFVKGILITVEIAKTIPDEPVYNESDDSAEDVVLEAGTEHEFSSWWLRASDKFTIYQLKALHSHKEKLFIYGYLTFKDFVGTEHRRGFIYQANSHSEDGSCYSLASRYPKYDYQT